MNEEVSVAAYRFMGSKKVTAVACFGKRGTAQPGKQSRSTSCAVKTATENYRFLAIGANWYRFGLAESTGNPLFKMRESTNVKDLFLRKGLAFLSIP